jgi:hypothetical protein
MVNACPRDQPITAAVVRVESCASVMNVTSFASCRLRVVLVSSRRCARCKASKSVLTCRQGRAGIVRRGPGVFGPMPRLLVLLVLVAPFVLVFLAKLR